MDLTIFCISILQSSHTEGHGYPAAFADLEGRVEALVILNGKEVTHHSVDSCHVIDNISIALISYIIMHSSTTGG
jgi:hypothetical protein